MPSFCPLLDLQANNTSTQPRHGSLNSPTPSLGPPWGHPTVRQRTEEYRRATASGFIAQQIDRGLCGYEETSAMDQPKEKWP